MSDESLLESVYDRMADEYGSHQTSSYFSYVQDIPISQEIFRNFGNDRRYLDILIVGVGDHRTHMRQIWHPIDPYAPTFERISLFDISKKMLNKIYRKAGKKHNRVHGDAKHIETYFEHESFDIVLAGLCDHIEDQDAFYEGSGYILKPSGMLLTTYPGKEMMYKIRRDILEIPEDTTRFVINEEEFLVPSFLYSPDELYSQFEKSGFSDIKIMEIKGDDEKATEVVSKGCDLLGSSPSGITNVIMGSGKKR